MVLVMKLLALFVHLEMQALLMVRSVVVLIAVGRFRRNLTEILNKTKEQNYWYFICVGIHI